MPPNPMRPRAWALSRSVERALSRLSRRSVTLATRLVAALPVVALSRRAVLAVARLSALCLAGVDEGGAPVARASCEPGSSFTGLGAAGLVWGDLDERPSEPVTEGREGRLGGRGREGPEVEDMVPSCRSGGPSARGGHGMSVQRHRGHPGSSAARGSIHRAVHRFKNLLA